MAWFKRAVISAAGILVALILVGAAVAGNGNGSGNGNGNAGVDGNGGGNGPEHTVSIDAQPQTPGKSAAAPGQVKKDATPVPQAAPAKTPAPTTTVAQTPQAPTTASVTGPGVKPSNGTSRNTSCVTGQGSGANTSCTGGSKPDSSKQYGNGTSAAQIATSRGGNGVTLKGPGNSQPHKVVACGRRHPVDVHAVKHYNAYGCAGTPTSTPEPSPNPGPTPNPKPNPTPNPTPPGDPGDPSHTPSPHGHISVGRIDPPVRVLGRPAQDTHKQSVKPASAVLSEAAAAVPPVLRGTLPFTGFPLWIVAVTAVALIATGIAMRKRAHSPERRKL